MAHYVNQLTAAEVIAGVNRTTADGATAWIRTGAIGKDYDFGVDGTRTHAHMVAESGGDIGNVYYW